MKTHTILLFILLLAFVKPDCKAGVVDSLTAEMTHQQEISTKAAEVLPQCECTPIYDTNVLMEEENVSNDVDKTNTKSLDDYIAEQNKLYEKHDGNMSRFLFIMGTVLILIMALFGIVIPLFMDRKREKELKNMEKMVMAAEDAARANSFSKIVLRSWNEKDITVATQLIETHPDDAFTSFAYFVRGTIYGCNKNYQRAVEDLTKSIKINEFQLKHGVYHQCKGEYTEAIIRDFNILEAYNNRGKAYKKLKDFSHAIKDFEIVINNNPKNLEAFDNLAYSYEKQGNLEKALELYTEAIDSNPDNPDAYIYRGNYYYMKDDKAAIKDFDKAVKIKPNYEKAYERRGFAKGVLKDFEGAIKDYTEAIRLRPDYAEAYKNRGNEYFIQDDYNKAISDYTEAIRLRPDDADAYFKRGYAYKWMGENDKAILDFTEAISLRPDDESLYKERGMVYDKMEAYEKAIADYTEAIRLRPDDVLAYYARGLVYEEMGENEKAISDYTEAIRLSPDNEILYKERGMVYDKMEAYEKAISDLTEAIRLRPDDVLAYFERGRVYEKMGENEKAISDYTEAKDRV